VANRNRKRILARDHYTCLWCGERHHAGNLDIHHLVPRQLDGPDRDWNLAVICRHHHLLMNVAQQLSRFERWWKAGEANLALGECFAWGLAASSKNETEMPQHVRDAITEAFRRMNSPLPDRCWDDGDWTLADLVATLGSPVMFAGAA
jgi:hypothetical protein